MGGLSRRAGGLAAALLVALCTVVTLLSGPGAAATPAPPTALTSTATHPVAVVAASTAVPVALAATATPTSTRSASPTTGASASSSSSVQHGGNGGWLTGIVVLVLAVVGSIAWWINLSRGGPRR